jgi:hypothetical protein
MPRGYGDTQFIEFPEGQSDDYIRTASNQMGISMLQFVQRVDSAVAALNTPDPIIDMLSYRTTNRSVTQRGSDNKKWQRSAEYVPGRPQLGQPGKGFQLPLYSHEIDLGFTRRGLMRMGLQQFTEEVQSTIGAVRRGRRADVLDRFFSDLEFPLDDDGVGASPGYAGSGTGTNVFEGNFPNNVPVPVDYTHYFQADDTEAGIHAAIMDALEALDNWGGNRYYEMIGDVTSIAQIQTYAEDAKFVSAGSQLIRPAEAQSQALVNANTHLGVYAGRIRVRPALSEINGRNIAIFYYGGQNNPQNPLTYIYDELFGLNAYVEDRVLYPLAEAAILQTYGIGVGASRTGAVVISIGGTPGTYARPAILR